jgi:hypothetical protein
VSALHPRMGPYRQAYQPQSNRFKTMTTNEYIRGVKTGAWPPFNPRLWQRNYYEHVIRNKESLNHIRQCILDNPARWEFDREHPAAMNPEPKDAWLSYQLQWTRYALLRNSSSGDTRLLRIP